MEKLTPVEIEQNLRKESAQKEEAWKNCGKTEGLEIWRIENLKVVPWQKEEYGTFFSGDSYIILHTKNDGDHFDYTTHVWLGNDTSKDEAGIASFKILELDDFLNKQTTMICEKEGNESDTFLSYFKTFTIMKGGIDSEYKYASLKGAYVPKLFKVHGRGNCVHSHEVDFTMKSMNPNDVFVLDAGLKIYNWRGKNSTGFEKFQGTTLVNKLWEERNKKPELITIEQGDHVPEFFEYLKKAKIEESTTNKEEKKEEFKGKMMRLKEENGKISFEEVEYKKEKLDTNDAFIIDNGKTIYVWIGNGASKTERRFSMVYARRYLTNENKPCNFPIVTVREGKMTDEINSCFK